MLSDRMACLQLLYHVASWYYLISGFRNFRHHPLLFHLVDRIAYLPGHGDIFWHKDNRLLNKTRDAALEILRDRFGRAEVICMLEILTDGGGFGRGAIGASVEAIVSQVRDRDEVLRSVALDSNMEEEVRYWALLLLVTYLDSRTSTVKDCLSLIDKYQDQFPGEDSDIRDMVWGIREEIVQQGRFTLFC